MVKSPTYDENGMKKGAWSKEEDEKLIAYIQKYGHWNWRQLPKYAGLARCGKSCRLRWMNYLRPNLKHGNYTKEEEEIIIKSHEELGNNCKITRKIGQRNKNYWNSRLKNRLKRASSTTEAEETTGKQIEGGGDSEIENPPMIFESCNTSSAGTSSGKNAVASPMSETFEECSGNFWTDPFVPDSTYYHQDNYWEDYDCIMRDCSCHGDETDLYYQVMQELPKND